MTTPHHAADLARLEAAFEDGRLSGLDGTAADCPFDHPLVLIRTAWHAGFLHGRAQARMTPIQPDWWTNRGSPPSDINPL